MTPRYQARTMRRARELRTAGWSLRQIAGLLEGDLGHRVSHTTLMRWTDPKQAELQRKRVYAANRRALNAQITGRMPGTGNLTTDFRMIRLGALDRLGLSANAIATVMSFDFPGSPVSEHQVRRALETGRWPAQRRVAA